jgi:hypothetical protein
VPVADPSRRKPPKELSSEKSVARSRAIGDDAHRRPARRSRRPAISSPRICRRLTRSRRRCSIAARQS